MLISISKILRQGLSFQGLIPRPSRRGSRSLSGYLRDTYPCQEAWEKRLQSSLLQKVNPDDLFFEMDKRYQADKVLSAVDVDIYVNRVTDPESLDEMEEVVYRLRKSPATCDALPSTSHALVRAFLAADKTQDLLRILNDRINYGIFLDHHVANVLMDHFLRQGNHRDAVKVASLLMLEEDFGPPTTKLFCLLACLKYLHEPKPEGWEESGEAAGEGETADAASSKDKDEEEVKKVRVGRAGLRNVYFDQHFDLWEGHHLVGKTLARVGASIDDETLSRTAQLMGWALFGKWDLVATLLARFSSDKKPIYGEVIPKIAELVDAALAEVESSPTKTLAKPKIRQLHGMNLEEKDTTPFWKRINYPAHEKHLSDVKAKLAGKTLTLAEGQGQQMIQRVEHLLSSALAEREEQEMAEQVELYKSWEGRRMEELERQVRRFRAYRVTEEIEAKKKELREKEEVIFFFDHEEEWMMRLPEEEQDGYKLSEEYVPFNATKFVKVIPPKKDRNKRSKV